MSFLLAAALIIPAGESFVCTPTRVWDGDGPLWCAEGPRIRLSGIAAREIDETCRSNQPCPSAGGVAARDALVALVGHETGRSREGHVLVSGPAMVCLSSGGDNYGRTTAWCVSPQGGDINCTMVASGYALRWDRHWKDHQCSAK